MARSADSSVVSRPARHLADYFCPRSGCTWARARLHSRIQFAAASERQGLDDLAYSPEDRRPVRYPDALQFDRGAAERTASLSRVRL